MRRLFSALDDAAQRADTIISWVWYGWKTAAKAAGRDLIDLSVGASDLPCPPEALESLRAATHDPSTYSYCLKNNTMPLLTAACDWYARRYNVHFNPTTEALALIGSQEGLAHLLLGVTEHGDHVLMCDVAYPSYFGALTIAGLKPCFLPMDEASGLPDLNRVQPEQLGRAKVLLLNYPNNPTAVTATNEFFTTAIRFCQDHGLLLIHDNPYVDQSHHIAGFRLGFALGAADAIAALEAVKAPIDFNAYIGIQRMGVTCLALPEDRVKADAQVWRRRASCMVNALARHAGWRVRMPSSGMYLWALLPEAKSTSRSENAGLNAKEVLAANGLGEAGSVEQGDTASQGRNQSGAAQGVSQAGFSGGDVQFCQELLAATGVALSPGSGFGPGGKGKVRFALVAVEDRLEVAAQRIGHWLASLGSAVSPS